MNSIEKNEKLIQEVIDLGLEREAYITAISVMEHEEYASIFVHYVQHSTNFPNDLINMDFNFNQLGTMKKYRDILNICSKVMINKRKKNVTTF
jgi:hypothetical protein